MCDYSLHNVKTRPAQIGDKLTIRTFETGTRGFLCIGRCERSGGLLPGTELAFVKEVAEFVCGRGARWSNIRPRSSGK